MKPIIYTVSGEPFPTFRNGDMRVTFHPHNNSLEIYVVSQWVVDRSAKGLKAMLAKLDELMVNYKTVKRMYIRTNENTTAPQHEFPIKESVRYINPSVAPAVYLGDNRVASVTCFARPEIGDLRITRQHGVGSEIKCAIYTPSGWEVYDADKHVQDTIDEAAEHMLFEFVHQLNIRHYLPSNVYVN